MSAPNILILMVDQLNGTLFPDGPADWLHAPNLKALAERSVRFANAYTASPLCAPGRASFMSGQLPSATGVYDNAAEFRSAITCAGRAITPAFPARCISSGRTSFTASRNG
jgi:choline-sulfatase